MTTRTGYNRQKRDFQDCIDNCDSYQRQKCRRHDIYVQVTNPPQVCKRLIFVYEASSNVKEYNRMI